MNYHLLILHYSIFFLAINVQENPRINRGFQDLKKTSIAEIPVCPNSLPEPFITSDTICEGENASLLAFSSAGTIHWFTTPAEDIPFLTGNNFSTPTLNISTTYYVEAMDTFSYALQFSGGNNWVNCGNPPNNLFSMLEDGTIEAWVQSQGTLPGYHSNTCNVILGKDEGPGNNRPKWFFGLQNGGLAFHINGPGYWNGYWAYSDAFVQPPPGQWYHVAVVKSDNYYTFYFNGTLVGGGALPQPIVTNNAPLTIGWGEPCCQAGAIIDELRFYNTARTFEEIASSMNQCAEPNAPGLIAYYPMNDMPGQNVVTDYSGLENHGTLINMDLNSAWVNGYDLKCFGECIVTSNRIPVAVLVIPNPSPTIIPSSSNICNNQTITLDGGSGYTFYQWNGVTENTRTLTVSEEGTYYLIVTDAQGCSGTDSIIITENNSLMISESTILMDTCGMGNGVIDITTMGSEPPFSYLWSNGATSEDIAGLTEGNYFVTITDSFGCTLIEMFSISELSTFGVMLNTEYPPCPEEEFGTICISVQGETGPYLYELDGGGFIQDSCFYAVDTGIHTLIIQGVNGCEVIKEALLSPAPTPLIDVYPKDTTINLGDIIQLSFQANFQPDSIAWEGTDMSCSNCLHPYVSPSRTQVYELTLTTPEGCMIIEEITIQVEKNRNIFIPNAFSPNADGFNDYFSIFSGEGIQRIKELQIFDRWGGLVFSQRNLPLNDPITGWDGTSKGKPVQSGIFTFFIEIELTSGKLEVIEGDVIVIR